MPFQFESLRFGPIEAGEEEVIRFPGLPGFPEARQFVFRAHDCGMGFGWMICVDDPALAFVVADPLQLVRDYEPEIPHRSMRALGARNTSDLEIVVIATVSAQSARLNLAAPIVVNRETRRGLQVLLESGGGPGQAQFELRATVRSSGSERAVGLSEADPSAPRSSSLG